MPRSTVQYRLPLLAVQDVSRSKAFYCGLFGQQVTMDFGENVTFSGGFAIQQNFDWLVEIPPTSIVFKAHNMELYFETEDFDGFLLDLAEYPSAHLVHPPKEHDWRQRVVRLYDPDGHMIEVGESMEVVVQRCLAEGLSQEEAARITQHPLEFVQQVARRGN